ncbi:hypothetical protein HYW40_02205 [Candidatus Curtissbacteria bacterium]|nr:hypothetical protein [Candidatus Curtissbacteria bacterium]
MASPEAARHIPADPDRKPVHKRILPWFEGLNNPGATNEEIQALLNNVGKTAYGALLRAGLIVTVTSVAKEAGLHPDARTIPLIHKFLQEEKIPAGRFPNKVKTPDGGKIIGHYNFIAKIHKPDAVESLSNAAEFAHLRNNPVVQIAGPIGERLLPNTTELRNSEKHDSIGNLISGIRGKRWSGKGRLKATEVIRGSPVEIYTEASTSGGWFYPRDKEGELEIFLRQRIPALGLSVLENQVD